jgi:hypothetical protein
LLLVGESLLLFTLRYHFSPIWKNGLLSEYNDNVNRHITESFIILILFWQVFIFIVLNNYIKIFSAYLEIAKRNHIYVVGDAIGSPNINKHAFGVHIFSRYKEDYYDT